MTDKDFRSSAAPVRLLFHFVYHHVLCQAYALQMAQQHYSFHLKKKVWFAWHSLIEKHWKVKVERACRLRAEEVCSRLSNEYEAKLAEVNTPKWMKDLHTVYDIDKCAE